ncbi:MAG: polysaccharide deacetylase [Acidobacteria bacterium OLB17]|nr:MAG: polysaccharide deacetylase [Acidobacteria bacterium OLB17]MCZ2389884.1 polysaccharide deacetylase family protein [Acidobacteriota bacterium]
MLIKPTFVLVILIAYVGVALGQSRTIAITIDDLPVVSTRSDLANRRKITRKLLGHIAKAKIPAIGFVNENKLYTDGKRDDKQIDLLRSWLKLGLELGNHTYSHISLHGVSVEEYEADAIKGETITKELLTANGRELRYFRHPYLMTGLTLDVKAEVARFLDGRGYTVAPITFDNADYIFSRAYDNAFDSRNKKLMNRVAEAYVPYMEAKIDYWERQSAKLFGREISQTMLIHANFINSDYLDDLIKMLRRRGYTIIDLDSALKDEAYRLPDTYLGRSGISWLHRWALAKGNEYVLADEPRVPEFVMKASGFESE